jgi:hypothetical protein
VWTNTTMVVLRISNGHVLPKSKRAYRMTLGVDGLSCWVKGKEELMCC